MKDDEEIFLSAEEGRRSNEAKQKQKEDMKAERELKKQQEIQI